MLALGFQQHSELVEVWLERVYPEAFQPTPRELQTFRAPGAGAGVVRGGQGTVNGDGQEGAEGGLPKRRLDLQPKSQSPALSSQGW